MDYNKPDRKKKANEEYLRKMGMVIESNPYEEEQTIQKKLFLIICEGKNTEPKYFESFPVPTNTVITDGARNTKTALVEYAISIKDEDKYKDREIWCVFDFDINPDEAATQPEDFNSAIEMAVANGMKVAWSNDAFELWFALHYRRIENALTREDLYKILKATWGLQSFSREAKTENFCIGHYDRHGGTSSEMQKLAIRRAKELHEQFGDRKDFANHCPCTTVYLLVEELNKNIKK